MSSEIVCTKMGGVKEGVPTKVWLYPIYNTNVTSYGKLNSIFSLVVISNSDHLPIELTIILNITMVRDMYL